MDFNKVYEIAKMVRDEILCEGDTDSTHGLCAYCSKELRTALAFHFIEAKIVKGTFAIDSPDPEYYPEEMEGCEEIYFPTHYWVEVDGYIVDITADQFNDEIDDEPMPEVVIGKYEALERYSK